MYLRCPQFPKLEKRKSNLCSRGLQQKSSAYISRAEQVTYSAIITNSPRASVIIQGCKCRGGRNSRVITSPRRIQHHRSCNRHYSRIRRRRRIRRPIQEPTSSRIEGRSRRRCRREVARAKRRGYRSRALGKTLEQTTARLVSDQVLLHHA